MMKLASPRIVGARVATIVPVDTAGLTVCNNIL